MQIVNATTPANFFHALRRQLKREFRTPLIVFTPKSLLRHPEVMSTVDELAKGGFKELIKDTKADKKAVKTIVACSGKLYYEINNAIKSAGVSDIALVRVEQLYPFPQKQFNEMLTEYSNLENLVWAQEEPENMGPWRYIKAATEQGNEWEVVSRHASASPASGSSKVFAIRQKSIIDRVLSFSMVES